MLLNMSKDPNIPPILIIKSAGEDYLRNQHHMKLVPTKPSLKHLVTMTMTMTMSTPRLLVLLLVFLPFLAADPDPLQDFCVADLKATSISINGLPCKPASQVASADFFFDGLAKEGNTTNVFGVNVTLGNVFTFPGLNTLGISMNRVDYAPGGVNPPHSHPRATETVLVINGKLLIGFVTTNNVLYSKVLSPGEMFVIPPGLVHFQQNVGEGKALSITAFNSQFPGAVVLPQTLFGSNPSVPSEVLSKAFQMGPNVVTEIKSKFGN